MGIRTDVHAPRRALEIVRDVYAAHDQELIELPELVLTARTAFVTLEEVVANLRAPYPTPAAARDNVAAQPADADNPAEVDVAGAARSGAYTPRVGRPRLRPTPSAWGAPRVGQQFPLPEAAVRRVGRGAREASRDANLTRASGESTSRAAGT